MAIVPDQSPTQSATAAEDTDFGANDWLLEEMYEQFSADPDSVDPAWAKYFATHGAPGEAENGSSPAAQPNGSVPAKPASAPAPAPAAEPAAQTPRTTAPPAPAPAPAPR